MGVNDRILSAITARQIDLVRAGNSQSAELLGGSLSAADEKLAGIIAGLPDNPTPLRLKRAEERIRAALAIQERLARRSLRSFAESIADDELEMMNALLGRVFRPLGISPRAGARGEALGRVSSVPIRGTTFARLMQRLFRNDRERVLASFRSGFGDGQTADQVRRSVVGTTRRRLKDGVRQVSRRSIDAIVQTTTTHAATQARGATYEANPELIREERWVSTLDSRTSPICQSLDGRVFDVGKGPHPPIHPNCRSARMPIVPELEALPVDPEVQTVLPVTVADSFDGKGPVALTYTEWLRKQPKRVQRSILGPTRFALFETGDIGPRGFVNDRGRRLTIDELRARHRSIFDDAGLLEE